MTRSKRRTFTGLLLLLSVSACACTSAVPTEEAATQEDALRAPPALLPPSCPSAPDTFQKFADVAYANAHPAQKLDVYVPNGPGPFPLVIWVHGGGWQTGDKAPTQALAEARRGYVVASVNYRLSGDATFPAQIYDVKAALRFLRANATKYKIDREHVGAWGPSAGGHLVALLGTSSGVAAMEDLSMGNAGESSRVQAVVDFFGPTDFSKRHVDIPEACNGVLENDDDATSPMSKLLGCSIQSCPDAVKKANPITYVNATDPPFMIMHGDSDCTVVPNQSQLIFDALRAAGVPASLEFLPGVGHGAPEFFDAAHRAKVNQFLDARLKGCR